MTKDSLIRCGYKRIINLYHVVEINWEFDKDGGDIKVIVWYGDSRCEHYYMDEEEFATLMGGLNRALV